MIATLAAAQMVTASELDVYFGTYTRNSSSAGIYHAVFNPDTGRLSEPQLAAAAPNPSFLAVHPNRRFLYAVSEDKTGTVRAFAINPGDGKLTLLNERSSGGTSPCHLAVDHDGSNVYAVNYSSGSVTMIPVMGDGSLAEPSDLVRHQGSGVNPKRQKGPHAHSVNLSPDQQFALVADLGIDRIVIYRPDRVAGKLRRHGEAKVKPGAGPRHLAFSPDGRFVYVVNELDETVTVFAWDAAAGKLTELQTAATLPPDFHGVSWCAEIAVRPDGRFLYASNRGHDSLAVFRIDPAQGTLTPAGWLTGTGIKNPRHFAIDPSGRFCLAAGQDSDNVVVCRIDAATGALVPTGRKVKIGKPVCIRFVPR